MSEIARYMRPEENSKNSSWLTPSQVKLKLKMNIDPKFWSKTTWIQLGYGLWVNLTVVTLGMAYGFSAVTVPQLNTTESQIKTTLSQRAWITSVLPLSSVAGCLMSGILMDKWGRKLMIVLCHVPLTVGWLCIGCSKSASEIIIGRVINGVGCGMAMGVPRAYITEITLPNIRGVVGAGPNLAMATGITIQALMGTFFNWKVLAYICCAITCCMFIANIFLPETPYFVLMRSTKEETRATLMKFRSKNYDIDDEMKDLIEFKTANNIRRLDFKATVLALFTRAACQPFCIIMPYILAAQLSGVSITMFWTVELIRDSKSTIEAYTGNVLIGITRIGGGILTTIMLFKFGRRPLALTSALGMGVICISLGLYIIYTPRPTVFPQILYMAYICFCTFGYYTLPFLIIFEISPLQVRGIIGSVSISASNLLMFAANEAFPYVRKLLGFPITMIAFGISSLLGCIYLYFCLPETKGLTLAEIEEYFNTRRATLISQRRIQRQSLAKSRDPSSSQGTIEKHKEGTVNSIESVSRDVNASERKPTTLSIK